MTNLKFFETIKNIEISDEIKIRYYTYNKNDYIDIIGIFSDVYGDSRKIYGGGLFLVIEYIGTYKYHNNFKEKNIPKLRLFNANNKQYCYISSQQVLFVEPASIRAYKINKIRNRII